MDTLHTDKKVKKLSFYSFLIFLLIQGLTLVPPIIMKKIIDIYIPNKDVLNIIFGIVLFAVIPIIFITFQTIYNYFCIKFARNKGNEIAIKILKNIINQDINYFDKQKSIELVTYSGKEAVQYVNFYVCELPKYYVAIVISIILGIVLFISSPVIGFIQLLFIPLAIMPIRFITKRLQKYIQEIITKNANISQTKADMFKGIEFIKSMRLEEKKVAEVENYNDDIVKIWGKVAAFDSLSGIWISGFLSKLFTGITFGVGAYLVIKSFITNVISLGTLVSIISYAGLLYAYIDVVFKTKINRKKQQAEFQKLFSYMDIKGEIEENESKQEFHFTKDIVFKNCSFKYESSEQVLDSINIKISKGKWIGLIGKSGSGKSTLFNLLIKLYKVENDSIFIDGTDINEINSFRIRENISKVSQDIFLFPGTIKDNLLLINPNASDKELNDILKFVCLDNYIESLPQGINTDIGEAGKLMSGGEKQRLSLAQALIRGKKILLLDEVTSNLDSSLEKQIRDNIKKLVDEKGYTIISISHRLEFLYDTDYVYEIMDGKIVREGTIRDFVNSAIKQ